MDPKFSECQKHKTAPINDLEGPWCSMQAYIMGLLRLYGYRKHE